MTPRKPSTKGRVKLSTASPARSSRGTDDKGNPTTRDANCHVGGLSLDLSVWRKPQPGTGHPDRRSSRSSNVSAGHDVLIMASGNVLEHTDHSGVE